MIWQEIVFTLGSLIFSLTLLPVLWNRDSAVPRTTSMLTASILGLYALAFTTLDLWFSAVSVSLTAGLWLAIAIFRPVPKLGVAAQPVYKPCRCCS